MGALQTSRHRYGLVAQAFHWLTVLALIGAFGLGLVMVDLAMSPLKLKMYSWHKWLGVCLWAFVVLRLLWHLRHPAPPLPVGMPDWQRRTAKTTHMALYALLVVLPLTGWLMSSAQGFSTVLFGRWELPDAIGENEALGDILREVHWWLNKSLLLLVLLHVAAVLKHQLVDRDGLIWRMLPIGPRPAVDAPNREE